jgi:hypothetical protein
MQGVLPTSKGDDIEGLVVLLLRQGSKADAIKLIQDETGASRAEAQRQVTEVARRYGIASSNWPAALALTLVVLGAVLLIAAAV